MKRGRRNLLIMLGCAFLALVTWALWPGEREPEYQGKKLSQWRQSYLLNKGGFARPRDAVKEQEAVQAVNQMRDQVIPHALTLLSYNKPAWMDRARNVMEKMRLRAWGPSFLWLPFYVDRNFEGYLSFQMLGSNAAPAIPALEKLATDPNPKLQMQGAMAGQILADIGEQSLPTLIRIAKTREASSRFQAVKWIAEVGSNAAPALPEFIGWLSNAEPVMACNGAWILGELKLEPEKSITALTNQFWNSNVDVRRSAILALGQFGRDATSAVPLLSQAYWDLNPRIHEAASKALMRVAPEVLTNDAAK